MRYGKSDFFGDNVRCLLLLSLSHCNLLYRVSIPQNITEIRSVDREIFTNEVKVTFSAPLRCPYFEGFFRNNIILNQYNLLTYD